METSDKERRKRMVREWISELRNSDRGAEVDQLTRQRRLGSLATGGRAGESGLIHPGLASGTDNLHED